MRGPGFLEKLEAALPGASWLRNSRPSIRGSRSPRSASPTSVAGWESSGVAVRLAAVHHGRRLVRARSQEGGQGCLAAAPRTGLPPLEHGRPGEPRHQDEAAAVEGRRARGSCPRFRACAASGAGPNWHEREVYDMSGVTSPAIPDLRRILCPEDWEGYPLRKDYEMPLDYHGIRGKPPGAFVPWHSDGIDGSTTIRGSSSSTSAPTRCSSTWGRSTPARTACSGSCSAPTARSCRRWSPTSATCTAAPRRSARTSPPAVHPVHRPDGLSGGDEHESRLGSRRREADEVRGEREGPAPAGADRRTSTGSPATWSAWGPTASTSARSARFSTRFASGRRSSTSSRRPAAPGSPTATSPSAA
jgi:hypothetical protein